MPNLSHLTLAQLEFYLTLKSGRYPQQDHGWLRGPDGFCVLGVACDLWDRKQKTRGWHQYTDGQIAFHGHVADLPDQVRQWLGLEFSEEFQLMIANDSGHDFESLAQVFLDMIEAKRERQLDQLEDVLEDHRNE